MFMRAARQSNHFRKIQCTHVTQQLGRQLAQKSALPCICILLEGHCKTAETPHRSRASCMPETCHLSLWFFPQLRCFHSRTGVVVQSYPYPFYKQNHYYTYTSLTLASHVATILLLRTPMFCTIILQLQLQPQLVCTLAVTVTRISSCQYANAFLCAWRAVGRLH